MGLIANPVIQDSDCTLTTCSLLQAHFLYVPNLAGNALFAGIFGLALILQILFGVRYRTWGYLGGMFGGCLLEVIGYVGRIQMHSNPFTDPPFLTYLICLTIGPAFLTASIYLCLARIVVVYGEGISRFKPRVYTLTFITFDFLSLLLQAAGGAIASTANTPSSKNTGVNIMIAGLAWQVFSLFLFGCLCSEFAYRVHKASHSELNENFASLRMRFRFKAFMVGLGVAGFTIFIRSSYRCAELSGGFHGKLANQQITFMILEGAMVIIAVSCLTVFHPGLAFCGAWGVAGWSLRQEKTVTMTGNQEEKGKRWSMKGMPWQGKNHKGEAKAAEKRVTRERVEMREPSTHI